jgi:hypothetical protein
MKNMDSNIWSGVQICILDKYGFSMWLLLLTKFSLLQIYSYKNKLSLKLWQTIVSCFLYDLNELKTIKAEYSTVSSSNFKINLLLMDKKNSRIKHKIECLMSVYYMFIVSKKQTLQRVKIYYVFIIYCSIRLVLSFFNF